MLQSTKKDPEAISDRSYQLLSLLEVCRHSAKYISEGNPKHASRDAGELADVLKLAIDIACEVHNFVEVVPRPKLEEVAS